MNIKYALYPRVVKSRFDGDRHYINPEQLARLYGVNYKECIVVDYTRPEAFMGRDLSKYVSLRVRDNGDYPVCKC